MSKAHTYNSEVVPVSTFDQGCLPLVGVLGVTRCIGGLLDVSASTCRRRFGMLSLCIRLALLALSVHRVR